MTMPEFLFASELMEVAETVEVMEVTEDFPVEECDAELSPQSIVLVNDDKEQIEPSTVEIIDLSQVEDNACNKCTNLNDYHDTSNIIGKNFSAILNGNITEKRLLEILDEQDANETEQESTEMTDDNCPKTEEENLNEKLVEKNDNIKQNINFNNNTDQDPYQIESSKIDNCTSKKYHFDADLAVNHLQEKCDLGDLLEAERRVLLQPVEVLCHADEDDDTPLMIIVSKSLKENSRFYENVFAMQERLQNIRMCCRNPIEDFLESCPICGKTDPEEFFTPLSCKNNVGDSALTCAIKMEHSEMIIDYLLSGILRNKNDVQKVFDEDGIKFCQDQVRYYPSLLRFILAPTESTYINRNERDKDIQIL